ncbi:MAG: hypothetical protein QXE70_10820 [Ignisphaera sp.]
MKQKLPVAVNIVLKIFEHLHEFAEDLDITVDGYGIVIVKKKGFVKPIEERLWLTFSIIRGKDEHTVVFRFSGSLQPISRIKMKSIDRGCEIVSECLGDKSICSYIDRMVKRLATNLDKIIEKMYKRTRDVDKKSVRFTMTLRYANIIDGLAEITLSSLYLRYPLLERRKMRLDEVKNLEEFLDKLYRKYGLAVKEIYVHVSDTDWMFILAVDLANMVYTPSFIENTFRVIGKEAIEKLMNKQDEYVTVAVLTTQS